MATATTRLGPADHGRAMTFEDFHDAEVEEGYRYELASGVVEVTMVPGEAHHLIVCLFYRLLALHMEARPGVIHAYGGGSEYRLWLPGMVSGRNPDVAVSLRNTPKDSRGLRPPSLAVEVVSEGGEARERDHVTKRQEYLAYGLREYWIVDPFERRVVVLIRDGDAWVERVFAGEQPAGGLVLPGLAVRPAELWAAAAEAEEGEAAG